MNEMKWKKATNLLFAHMIIQFCVFVWPHPIIIIIILFPFYMKNQGRD